jgi:hypothetical protein
MNYPILIVKVPKTENFRRCIGAAIFGCFGFVSENSCKYFFTHVASWTLMKCRLNRRRLEDTTSIDTCKIVQLR